MKLIYLVAGAYVVLSSAATGFCQVPGVPEVNPSFETPAEPGGSNTIIQKGAGSTSAVPGWSIDSAGGIFSIVNDQNDPGNALVNQNGNQYLEDFSFPQVGYSGAGTVSQILTTSFVAGENYELLFWFGNAGTYQGELSPYPAQLGDYVFIANSLGTEVAALSLNGAPTDGSLASGDLLFKSSGAVGDTGPIEIGIVFAAQTDLSTMAIDNMLFYIDVPEPSSTAMAVFGGVVVCILMAGARRRS